MSTEFENAVDFVERISAPWIENGKCDFSDLDPSEAILCLEFGIYYESQKLTPLSSLLGEPHQSGRYFCSESAGSNLLAIHRNSPAAFNLLCRISADYVYRQDELQPSLRHFTFLHLAGQTQKPKQKRIQKTAFRNIWLLSLARSSALEHNLYLTRNDETRSETSACDAVVLGLERNGHYVSYKAVKEICVGTTSRRIREVSDLWVDAYARAQDAKIIPQNVLDKLGFSV